MLQEESEESKWRTTLRRKRVTRGTRKVDISQWVIIENTRERIGKQIYNNNAIIKLH